jgi:hypothetical protein
MDRVFPPSISNGGREHEGMSLRDHFAGLAMQGLMTVYWETFDCYENSHELIKCQVEAAYEYADAMLKQRSLTND